MNEIDLYEFEDEDEGNHESNDRLRVLVDMRFGVQKIRIATGNRIKSFQRNNGDNPQVDNTGYIKVLSEYMDKFVEIETRLDRSINQIGDDYPILLIMSGVKGIGKVLAAQVVSLIDIHKADTVSALWRYAGYAVFDGQRERLKRGERGHYNTRLKMVCYKVSGSLIRCGSPYRRVYDDAKAYYTSNRADWTKSHIHNASLRKLTKVWLSHLWESWRKCENLPLVDLYVEEKLGHTHIYRAADFGW